MYSTNSSSLKLYDKKWIKESLRHNTKIEDDLHIIVVYSNPMKFKRRRVLFDEFMERLIHEENHIQLYVIELSYYDEDSYNLVSKHSHHSNVHHLHVRSKDIMWHKENMINVAVERLLPSDYKAFAWIDSDIEFENLNWVDDTLKLLNGYCDILQLFSHCCDLNADQHTMHIHSSFGYNYHKKYAYSNKGGGFDYFHPGYAWAMTRHAYEYIGGLFDKSIIGSGDYIMCSCLIGNGDVVNITPEFKKEVLIYEKNMRFLRIAYVPGVIRHHFHGTKQNRNYINRNQILVKYRFDPSIHLLKNNEGIYEFTNSVPQNMKDEIIHYFMSRKEDEC